MRIEAFGLFVSELRPCLQSLDLHLEIGRVASNYFSALASVVGEVAQFARLEFGVRGQSLGFFCSAYDCGVIGLWNR